MVAARLEQGRPLGPGLLLPLLLPTLKAAAVGPRARSHRRCHLQRKKEEGDASHLCNEGQ